MRRFLASTLPEIWQDKTHPVGKLLYPLSLIYQITMAIRRKAYQIGFFKSASAGVPVIIVGNISVGGTGKTPIVVWLSEFLQSQGLRVGIISRGYGGSSPHWPVDVSHLDKADVVGDEAILLKQKTKLPVFVSPIRIDAARALVKKHPVDVIISDDGLQTLSVETGF